MGWKVCECGRSRKWDDRDVPDADNAERIRVGTCYHCGDAAYIEVYEGGFEPGAEPSRREPDRS